MAEVLAVSGAVLFKAELNNFRFYLYSSNTCEDIHSTPLAYTI